MGKNDKGQVLGRSLIKERFAKKKPRGGQKCFIHTSELNDGYEWGRLNLASVTDQSNLEDFLATAELAGTEFAAEKLNVKFIDRAKDNGLPSAAELKLVKDVQEKNKELLRIPRRPPWDDQTTPEELDSRERELFLEWRRGLSMLQSEDHVTLTPYEKNLDFWRQLWRVIERSDVIVQIVDGRNPLLFRCEDIEKYVKEVDPTKVSVLLINKADLLTEKQRQCWAKYFTEQGIPAAFWSALEETARQQQLSKTEKEIYEMPEELKKLAESTADDNDDDDDPAADNDGASSHNKDNAAASADKTKVDADKKCEKVDQEVDNKTRDCGDPIDRASGCDVLSRDPSSSQPAPKPQTDVEKMMDSLCLAPPDKEVNEGKDVDEAEDEVDDDDVNDSDDDDDSDDGGDEGCQKTHATSGRTTTTTGGKVPLSKMNSAEILNTQELLDFLTQLHTSKTYQPGVCTLGMVGFPNVGKSSTINAILQTKKVPVSATPGRTKHFQTLYVDKSVMLCDCPGLVFPSFVSTKADLIINGILPIDQMRDHVPPVGLVCQQIPRTILEDTYGIMIPKPDEFDDPSRPPTALELLNAYGAMRGFMTQSSVPDCPRSSRYILKDYINGKLLYCHPPPGVDAENFSEDPRPVNMSAKAGKKERTETPQINTTRQTQFDSSFFSNANTGYVYSKGKRGVKGYARLDGLKQVGMTEGDPNQKPSKKHHNKNRKEKLRRVYRHLDQH
ncbi:large subunit GTPase 1 homolog [Argonauta hians]